MDIQPVSLELAISALLIIAVTDWYLHGQNST